MLRNEIESLESLKGCVFTPAFFQHRHKNRMPHIYKEVGLKQVNLCDISGKSRTQAQGFTEAECKRLYVPEDAEVFQYAHERNAWWIKCDRLLVDSSLSSQKVSSHIG